MPHATFTRPDLTTFTRLDELGLEVVGQHVEAQRAVLACRVVEPDDWCHRCGSHGVPRDTVVRRLAHEPFGWRPTVLMVTVRRYRCSGCGHVWRQDTSKAAEPRSKLSRTALRWALKGIVVAHLTMARVADGLAVSWNTANDADLAVEHERLVHTLGNLTLTGYNSEMSNSPFVTKRAQLTKSPLEMNKAIAAHDAWGPDEILSRGRALAEQIIALWPGPDESLVDQVERAGLAARPAPVVEQIPPGMWTSYTEVAVAVGSHPVAVGTTVASNPIEGAWRVMTFDGRPSPQFRWSDPDRADELVGSEYVDAVRSAHLSPDSSASPRLPDLPTWASMPVAPAAWPAGMDRG